MKSKKIISLILTLVFMVSICGASTVDAATVSGTVVGGKEFNFLDSDGSIACTYYLGGSFTVSNSSVYADSPVYSCKYAKSACKASIKDVINGKYSSGTLSQNAILYKLQYTKNNSEIVTKVIIVSCSTSGTITTFSVI